MATNDSLNPDGIADPIPCSTQCDWPLCMSNNGTICLFNLPDSYYDDMELSRLNHPSTPRPDIDLDVAHSPD